MLRNKGDMHNYLLIDANNVVSYPYDYNYLKYYSCNIENKYFVKLNEIFDEFDVPLDYRFLIIRINGIFSYYECQEYITETPFDYTGYTRFKKDDNPKIIKGRSVNKYPCNFIEFETIMDYKKNVDVEKFIYDLSNNGLIDRYKAAIFEMFSLYYSYENINMIKKYAKK